uniref:Uncharacterized protein n=1 Tax=Romanomermis culicivorax TaxID=13658 RepID=A0A915HHC9_ROMCU
MAADDRSLLHGSAVIMAGYWLCSAGINADGQFVVKDRVNIGMGVEIGADDTLIVSVIVEDYALDHMFTKCRFHCDDYWTMGLDNGAISDFDFVTYQELERLLDQRAFD